MPDTVLLTAASDGVAYHLAHRLCAQGHPVVLVTPVDGELDWIAAELVLQGADVRAIACDLEKSEGAQALFDELAADGVSVDMLVNNAGHTRRTSTDRPIRQCLTNRFLDVERALRMTSVFLPDMLDRGHGRILNVSSAVESVRAFASPRLASETFLLAWTEALAKELAGSPVTVAALVNPASGRGIFAGTDVAAVHGEPSPDRLTPRALADMAYDALLAGDPHGAAAAGRSQSRINRFASGGETPMHANWISTSAALPSEGTVVEFLIDGRECPMQGVYSLGRFKSRWSFYSPTRVCRWRETATVAREHELPSASAIHQQKYCFADAVMAAVAASLQSSRTA